MPTKKPQSPQFFQNEECMITTIKAHRYLNKSIELLRRLATVETQFCKIITPEPNYTQYFKYSQDFKYDNIKMVINMISYKPFYETLFKKGITEYNLIFKQGFSANTMYRIKKGEAINTKTLDALCYALDCDVSDIIEFVKE